MQDDEGDAGSESGERHEDQGEIVENLQLSLVPVIQSSGDVEHDSKVCQMIASAHCLQEAGTISHPITSLQDKN